MNILKKTMTTLCLSLIFLVSLNGNYAIANVKEIAQNNTKEQNEIKEVKNYSLVKTISKNGGKFAYYKHKKTGFSVVVSFPPPKIVTEIGGGGDINSSNLLIRNFAKDNSGVVHLLEHCLLNFLELEKKGNFFYLQSFGMVGPSAGTYRLSGGVGCYFTGDHWSFDLIDSITENLKDPAFLKDGGTKLETEKKRMDLELREGLGKGLTGISPKERKHFLDRFYNGKFENAGLPEEIKKVTLSQMKDQFKKIVNPANMLLTISSRRNPDYKEVMERFDEKYLSCFKGSTQSNLPKDFKKLVEKSLYREFNADDIKLEEYFAGGAKPRVTYYNKRARVFWDLEALTPAKKDIFMNLSEDVYNYCLGPELEKMGYSRVMINRSGEELRDGEFNPLRRDNLFCIDFYGNDPSAFEKDTLTKNAKELNAKFYEKIKNMSEKDIYDMFMEKNYNSGAGFGFYGKHYFVDGCLRDSFCFTDDPFSSKFFDIENGEIKFDFHGKRAMENIKKHKDEFKVLFEKNPNYIDVFTSKSKFKKEEKAGNQTKEFGSTYDNPVVLEDQNKEGLREKNPADYFKMQMAENFLNMYYLRPKIHKEGWTYYDGGFFPTIDCITDENLPAVEKFIFKVFVKDFKDGKIKPTQEEFEEIKKTQITDLKGQKSRREKFVKEKQPLLKNKKEMEKSVKLDQNDFEYNMDAYNQHAKRFRKYLDFELSKANKNQENIKLYKSQIEFYEKQKEELKKEYKEKFGSKKGIANAKYIKERIEDAKKETKQYDDEIDVVEKIDYSEMLEYFKNKIKIKKGSKLKKHGEDEKEKFKRIVRHGLK